MPKPSRKSRFIAVQKPNGWTVECDSIAHSPVTPMTLKSARMDINTNTQNISEKEAVALADKLNKALGLD